MKTKYRLFLLLMLSFMYLDSYTQSSKVIVFAPKGEKFILYLGSAQQNNEPQARVESDCPGGPTFKVKVTFSDPSIKEISKLVFNKPNASFYFKVDKNPKGAYVLESTSSEWSDVEKSKEETPPPPAPKDKKSATTKETVKSEPEKTTGGAGCSNPMEEGDFIGSLVSVSAPPFDPPKLSAAKKLASEHCLTTQQVIHVISVFDYESNRLSFAKFAYDHTWDIKNYSDVAEALHSNKSKTELEEFIKSKK
jgi:hypothetical protein